MVVTLRWLVLLAPLVASAGLEATASEPTSGSETAASSMSLLPPPPMTPVPARWHVDESNAETTHDEAAPLEAIAWTVDQEQNVDMIASRWGMKTSHLVELNPELQLRRRDILAAGSMLRVYAPSEEQPTQSIGSPNRGRLRHGMPMPEGRYWTLRERRARAFGAKNTISAMVAAFQRYGESFEDAPRVSIGEISARRGGRAAPHRSHRTGRDVDLGYILNSGGGGKRWRRADADNFDVEKNWALIQALVDTGEVQQIFISNRLQRLLRPVVREELGEEGFARYFHVPGRDSGEAPILKHWDGHRDHMHVRFRCEAGNDRCHSRSSRGRARSAAS